MRVSDVIGYAAALPLCQPVVGNDHALAPSLLPQIFALPWREAQRPRRASVERSSRPPRAKLGEDGADDPRQRLSTQALGMGIEAINR
jgi:hypothetical protein